MIKRFLDLVKFSHTIFALPFAFIGFFYALSEGAPFSIKLFVLMLLCMVFARNAAMAFNRYIDADIDKDNPRTANREIPAGKISKNQALSFILLNSALFLITPYFINPLCFLLAPLVLAIILGYSYTKRFTPLCHVVLGLGLAIAPLGAYLAVSPHWNPSIILFSFIVLTWVSGFDIIYALQDEEFDADHKLHSIPTYLGKEKALALSSFIHLITAILLIVLGFRAGFQWLYWAGAVFFIALLVYQHRLVKPNDLSQVNLAFFTTNGVASLSFALFVIADLFLLH